MTLDLSFISVLKVMPALTGVLAPGCQMVVLIKPQFEAGRIQVSSGGVVRDPLVSDVSFQSLLTAAKVRVLGVWRLGYLGGC